MSTSTKQHSIDYLNEYKAKSTTPNWLKLLIQAVLDKKGDLKDEDKDVIFEKLLEENKCNFYEKETTETEEKMEVEEVKTTKQQQTLTFQNITHKKGVNALIPDQSLALSNACTIVYGLNGTGKSGYFRIINELAGGDKTKSILGNIYQSDEGLEVLIDYSLDNKKQTQYKWDDKAVRGITPFNQVKVFDTGYLPLFLNERESSINIEPLGLNLFQVIISAIDEYKGKLDELIVEEKENSPDLDLFIQELYSDEVKELLQKEALTESQNKKLFEEHAVFTEEDSKKMEELEQEKNNLEKKNLEDTVKVIKSEKANIEALGTHLKSLKTNLEQLTKDVSQTIINYLTAKNARDEQIKQFEVLKQAPSNDKEEWQRFIESARGYENIIDSRVFDKDKKCIYCYQTLSDDAKKVVQAYSKYLTDKSQQNFVNARNKIVDLTNKLEKITPDYVLDENMSKALSSKKNADDKDFKTVLSDILENAKLQKVKLESGLKDFTSIDEKYDLEIQDLCNLLNDLSEQYQTSLDDLSKSEEEKQKKNTELTERINKLKDKQNLSKWKDKIKKYFESCHRVDCYSKANQTINTKGITDLGAKAHDSLLTETIRKAFEDELRILNRDIDIKLEKAGATKGAVKTRLKIEGKNVDDILSDGEQKGVGLALFLAEIDTQNDHSPVVFDDPVTSIDHEIADTLAKKLLEMSLERQIIIFTHNKLFFESLTYWANKLNDSKDKRTHHLCKNYGNGNPCKEGVCVYTYKVDRESKDRTGRIFEAQLESCEYYLKKAEDELKSDYSLCAVAGYLKSAIEHYVDEKILNKQGLVKEKKVGGHIEWEMLKGLNPDKNFIDQLKEHWTNLSNRGTHLSSNSSENPLSTEDLNKIITFLRS